MKIVSLFLLFVASLVHADNSLSTKIHNQYTSLRALGMGNAFTAVADDYSLIFYNPAGLAKKRYNEIQFSVIGAGVSQKTLTLMDDINNASKSGTDSQKAAAISTVLEQYYGKSLGGKIQAAEMFWTRKNWGIALIPMDLTIDLSINRQLGPAIDLSIIGDSTIAYGYGTELNKYLSAGATAKLTHRVSVDQSVSALELASDPNILSSKRFKEGNNIDFDLGFLWTPNWFNKIIAQSETVEEPKKEIKPEEPKKIEDEKRTVQSEEKSKETITETPAAIPAVEKVVDTPSEKKPEETVSDIKPKTQPESKAEVVTAILPTSTERFPLTFGLVIKNVLGGSFSKSKIINKDATEAPANLYRTIDLGSQYQLAQFGNLTMRSMIDFKDLLHPEITLTKSFHAGVEFDYYPNSWFKTQFRAGLNQMYFTGGATFLLGILNIDVVTYGEEVGTTSTKMENRIYAAKVGFNF